MFRGNHPAKIDEKGRLKLPSAFKQFVDAGQVTQFFITSTDGKSAEVWPLPEWEKVENRLADISSLDDDVEAYLKLVNYYGQQVEMDSQGRLLFPQILRSKARLDAEVTVIGMRDHLTVHNRELFEQALPPDGLPAESRRKVAGLLSRPQ